MIKIGRTLVVKGVRSLLVAFDPALILSQKTTAFRSVIFLWQTIFLVTDITGRKMHLYRKKYFYGLTYDTPCWRYSMEMIVKTVLGVALIPVLLLGIRMAKGQAGRGNLLSTRGLTIVRSTLVPALLFSIFWYLATDEVPAIFRLHLSDLAQTIGLLVFVASMVLRVWAQRVLERYWSTDISLRADHRLVQYGPYAWFCHPIYLSYWPLALGLLLATGNILIGGLATAYAIVSALRIRAEESILIAHFASEYHEYKSIVRMRWTMLGVGGLILSTCVGAIWEIILF